MGVKQPFDFDLSQVEFGIMDLKDMKPNPNNPRTISEKELKTLKNSLKDGPRNLLLNPIKLNSQGIIIGGNQRHTGLVQLGYKKVPYMKAGADFTQKEIHQFIVMDNVPAGQWNWQILEENDNYDNELLNSWGFPIPQWESNDDFDSNVTDTGDYDFPEDELPGSHVKMVQLFLNTQTEPLLKKWELKLREVHKTDNLTDTIYSVMKKAFEEVS